LRGSNKTKKPPDLLRRFW